MIDSTDGTVTPETVDREFYLRRALGRPTRRRMGRRQHLAAAQRARRALRPRPRLARRRRRASALADRRHGHEHRRRRRGRSRLEARGDAARLGRRGAARQLRSRAPAGRRARRQDGDAFLQEQRELPEGQRHARRGQRARAPACAARWANSCCAPSGRNSAPSGCRSAIATRIRRSAFPTARPPPPDDPAEYTPSARPGSRAPHVWLRDGRSTLDLYGRGFTLLRFRRRAVGRATSKHAARDARRAAHDGRAR